METPPLLPPTTPPGPLPLSPSDERMWAMLAHLSALAGFIIPFGNVVGPVVVWQIFKERSAFVDTHGREAVNFQITMTIAYLVSFILVFVAIGVFLLFVLGILSVVFFIIAAIKANNGEYYSYPFTFRFVK
ncbi:MAG: DUF4870 domain-containing protein [Bacteroidetes bacterium]|nr:DUF4870 domain-containing protein [Fibrella sp.]